MARKNRQLIQLHRGIRPVFFATIFIIGFGAVGTTLHHFSSAATSAMKLYLSPASQTVTVGDTITTQIRIQDTAKTYFAYAKAELTFPVNLLQVTSISTTGSDFSSADQETYSNTAGTLDIARGGRAANAQATDFLLATVTFTTKAAGNANIAFTSNSMTAVIKGIISNGPTNNAGGTYTIQALPTPPSNPGGGTTTVPTGAKPPATSTTPNTPATTTTPGQSPATTVPSTTQSPSSEAEGTPALVISRVHATNITTAGGTLEWRTSEPSTTLIRYDINSHNYSTKLSADGLETIHSIALHGLLANSTVYYKIVATAKDGSTATFNSYFTTAKPKNQAFTLVSAASAGGLGLVALALLVARLVRHRKLSKVDITPVADAAVVAPTADMSHAIATLALEQTTSHPPVQAIEQVSTPPIDEPESPRHSATQTSPRKRATIEPIPRKVVTTERPKFNAELPNDYTHIQIDESLDTHELDGQRPSHSAHPDGPEQQ